MACCSNCGQKIKSGQKFCPSCGTPIGGIMEQRKQVFQGELHKCPNCGEPLKAFQSVCPSCGYEPRNTQASNAVQEFSRKLEAIEAGRKPSKTSNSVAAIPINVLSKTLFGRSDVTDKQVLNHIRTFNVPNTKEDIIEFMILAASNINLSVYSSTNYIDAGANSMDEYAAMQSINDAWLAKVEQVYQKAKISFGNDTDFSRIQELYTTTVRSVARAKKAKGKTQKRVIFFGVACLLIHLLIVGIIGFHHTRNEQRLEQIVQEIQIDIANGDYDSALIKAQSLHMDDGWSNESEEHWDEQREALINLINEKKEGN